ncbi:hypothetical protein LWI29_034198 [Acer saccharum]|uniref:Uncharacterized protein n=1 Tax=Acer saccharum TaxID=4024 RepID=A0AA39TIG7_ACESA|nr:hypothetical protein LWI29_034198 [Acer saccharum]
MHLWDARTGQIADFSTHFSFNISQLPEGWIGDGLAFFLSPNGSQVPENATGGCLALFTNCSDFKVPKNPIVAVEFDTYQNGWDPNGLDDPRDHVGININSIKSVTNLTWGTSMKNGSIANAWISYNSQTSNLSLFLTYLDNPVFLGNSTLSYKVNLSKVLPEWVNVGFSSATGEGVEIHYILSWEFNSTELISDQGNDAIPPTSNNGNKAQGGANIGVVIGSVVGGLVLVGGVLSTLVFSWRKSRKAEDQQSTVESDDHSIDNEFEHGMGPKRSRQTKSNNLIFPNQETLSLSFFFSSLALPPSVAPAISIPTLMEGSANERLDFGKMGYGCKHYRRRCKIRAPCCNEIFECRHCHNEAVGMLKNPYDRHEINRLEVTQVICSVCDTEQPVAQVCTNCGVNMGEYFCEICKFYDDNTEKQQFHCDDCGICRVGGLENFFHCEKCGSCYSISLQDNHVCVENSMRHHCPICYEYLFDSLKDTTVMKCGHTMHSECYHEMIKHDKYCCPICSKSIIDMSRTWKRLDVEIEAIMMPEDYRYKKVWILCNDCNDTTEVYFHIIGQKCSHCSSYNTRTIAPPVMPQ